VAQGGVLPLQVDPRGARACTLSVARSGRRAVTQRLRGGEAYVAELQIAKRAVRTRWSVRVRCDGATSNTLRVKVSGRRGARGSRLVTSVTITTLDRPLPVTPPADPVESLITDEQGMVFGTSATQDGEPTDSLELGGGAYPNERIADLALSELGRDRTTPGPIDHGQCKQSVNDWVAAASGGTQRLGGNYHSNYASQGGHQVARDAAAKGDIIQLHNPANERQYFSGMHTAVVLGHAAGSESFDVVDANSKWDGVVRRHDYNPYAAARRYGLVVTIWRMGEVAAPAPVVTPTPPVVTPPTPPRTWAEQQGSRGVDTFTNPYNASGKGPRIAPYQWVDVLCKVYAPQIASANPDGYWYRIASAPWSGNYYSPANTFWNGDVPGRLPYTHNTDFNVPNC
jgi:hypothetical protein